MEKERSPQRRFDLNYTIKKRPKKQPRCAKAARLLLN
jgi:hypothetical protein